MTSRLVQFNDDPGTQMIWWTGSIFDETQFYFKDLMQLKGNKSSATNQYAGVNIDSSLSIPTSNEIRPVNMAVKYIIKAR